MYKYFYCYSLKLMKFLSLLDEKYIYANKHYNGNTCWVYNSTLELNKKLDYWNELKKIMNSKQEGE